MKIFVFYIQLKYQTCFLNKINSTIFVDAIYKPLEIPFIKILKNDESMYLSNAHKS